MSNAPQELVVLLDDAGIAIGTADKAEVHHGQTPRHLAFSCYVFDERDNILLSRRAYDKSVFPGLLTNSFCGHPAPAESLADAVRRRAADELGLDLDMIDLVLPGYAYRAEMAGIVENEACPVVRAFVSSDTALALNEAEVAEIVWQSWSEFVVAVTAGELAVSPWCAEQVVALDALGPSPREWPVGDPRALPPALR